MLLNIDIAHKVLRQDTALSTIKATRDQASRGPKRGDVREEILRSLVGATVMTGYNKATYQVTDIDFEGKPTDEFTLSDGSKVTYAHYYKNKYGVTVGDEEQPLLINENKRTGRKVHLIPELCLMTGLTDSMRANFNLMKELSKITLADPNTKMKEVKHLFQVINDNE